MRNGKGNGVMAFKGKAETETKKATPYWQKIMDLSSETKLCDIATGWVFRRRNLRAIYDDKGIHVTAFELVDAGPVYSGNQVYPHLIRLDDETKSKPQWLKAV